MNYWSNLSPVVFLFSLIILIILIFLFYQKCNKYKIVLSKIDNNYYKVLNQKNYKKAAERLAYLMYTMREFISLLKKRKKKWLKLDTNDKKYNKISMINRLIYRFPPKYVEEGKCGSNFISNKSDRLVICLREKDGSFKDFKKLNKVALHELAHIASKSTGHTDEFYQNHKFLSYIYKKIYFNNLIS